MRRDSADEVMPVEQLSLPIYIIAYQEPLRMNHREEPYNESKVLALLQNPDTSREGFEQVVRHYGRPLYWQIRRMVWSHDDADDLLQNTFIKAWTSLSLFRGEARLSTWLYRIAFNECLNFLSRRRETLSMDDEAVRNSVMQQLDDDPWFDGDQAERLLQEALLTLPEKQRMVFNLRYYDEMKYEQMSEIFGTSVGALKASYHHASKKVEQFFKESDLTF